MRFSPTSFEEAWNILNQVNVVSFDIWDTLITRMVSDPEDIFALLEKETGVVGLSKKRASIVLESSIQNPNIYELYQQLADREGWSGETCDSLIETELALEERFIRRREDMVSLMKKAVEAGKKVYLISDMYLTKEHMVRLLNSLEITGYMDVLVSCEYRQLKQDGLLDTFKKTLVDGESYIHIGDSVRSDVEPATAAGIDTLLIQSGKELLLNSPYYSLLEESGDSIKEHIIVGSFIAELFNSPFQRVSRGRRFGITDAACITKCFIAPLIVEYTRFLIARSLDEQYDTILFSARDGYLIQKIYDLWKEHDNSFEVDDYYFYASRQLCTLASLLTLEDVKWLASVPFDGDEATLLKERFGIEKQVEEEYWPGNEQGFIGQYGDSILKQAERVRQNYQLYIDRLGLQGKKNCFYDFVSSGTCQYYLDKIGLKDLRGEYFCYSKTQDERSRSKINGYYLNDGIEKAQSVVFKNYQFLELVMTSLEGSVTSMDDNGCPVLADDPRDSKELELVQNMHRQILEYARQYFELVKDYEELDEGKKASELIYGYLSEDYTDLSDSPLANMKLCDDWTGATKIVEASGEDSIARAIREKTDESIILENNDSWEHLYQFSPMRTGIIDWYPFEEEANLLEINAERGALTSSLCARLREIVALTDSIGNKELIEIRCDKNATVITSAEELQQDKLFDYVLIDGFKKGNELEYLKYLKKNGRVLICATNSQGARYQCGYPLPEKETSYTKDELVRLLQDKGIKKYKFYYPLPDYTMTQEVYSDLYLPSSSIKDRVIFYYPEANRMNRDENEFYDEAICQRTFDKVCNSYLIEATFAGELEDIVYATTSGDRAKDRRFSVAIHPDRVVKRPISDEAKKVSLESWQNLQELSTRGLRTVPCRMDDSTQVMPFVRDIRAVEYIYKAFKEDKAYGLDAMDRFIDCIRQSSDMDSQGMLTHGYIDLIPINAFVHEDEYIFYDQEFKVYNCELGYIVFRALRYLYLQYEELEDIVSLSELKERYAISQQWDKYLDMENEFIFQVRNHRENHTFYRLAANGYHKMDNPFAHKNILLFNGFDRFEYGENNYWSWAIARQTTIKAINNRGESGKYCFSCDIVPPPGLEQGCVYLLANGSKEELKTPIHIVKEYVLDSKEEITIEIEVNNELVSPGNGDPRMLAFQLINPRLVLLN